MGHRVIGSSESPTSSPAGIFFSTFHGGKSPKIWNRGSHFEVITTEASDTARNLGGFDMAVMGFDVVYRTAHSQREIVDRDALQNTKRRIKVPETIKC